jgi:hypothetical protein
MDFVGDYRAKQKLAARLRERQKALLGADIDTGPIVTQGQGAAPTQVQANPWGNIAKLGAAYFANQAGEKAATAETDAEALRMEALQNIMGGGAGAQGVGGGPAQPGALGGAAPSMTPEKALQLQQLGVDSGLIKTMLPKAPAIGALAQASATPEGRAFLFTSGQITKDQYDTLESAATKAKADELKSERELAEYKESIKRFAPTQGRGMTEIEFSQQDPAGYAEYIKAKNAGKPGATTPYDKKAAEEQAKQDVALAGGEEKLKTGLNTVNEFIAANEKKPYTKGAKYRAMDLVSEGATGKKASDFDPEVQIQEQAIQQFHLNAMEQMRGFGQVTENEQKIIAATQFDRYDSPEARTRKLKVIKDATETGLKKVAAAKQRLQSGGRQAAPAPADLDSEIDSLMGK